MSKPQSHFARDCLPIAAACLDSPDMVARAGCFTLLTIQQWLALVPRAFDDVMVNGAESRFAWGNKRNGVAYVLANKTLLHRAVERFHDNNDLDSLLLEYMAIPGLGIVKASFLAQLTVANGACLDVHNLRALGLDINIFKTPKTLKPEFIMKRLRTYNATWRAHGDSAFWWDSWCDAYAARAQAKSPIKYQNGSEVSRVHRVILGDYNGATA